MLPRTAHTVHARTPTAGCRAPNSHYGVCTVRARACRMRGAGSLAALQRLCADEAARHGVDRSGAPRVRHTPSPGHRHSEITRLDASPEAWGSHFVSAYPCLCGVQVRSVAYEELAYGADAGTRWAELQRWLGGSIAPLHSSMVKMTHGSLAKALPNFGALRRSSRPSTGPTAQRRRCCMRSEPVVINLPKKVEPQRPSRAARACKPRGKGARVRGTSPSATRITAGGCSENAHKSCPLLVPPSEEMHETPRRAASSRAAPAQRCRTRPARSVGALHQSQTCPCT
jgi:hypothetical protein